MKLRVLTFTLSSIISSVNYCASESTPIVQRRTPFTPTAARLALIEETRQLSAWDGLCKRNPRFVENMQLLASADESYNTGCWTTIGIQQLAYTCGFTCENPCLYAAAAEAATTGATLGLLISAWCGLTSMNIAWPLAVCVGTPCALTTCCSTCAAHKRCSSKNIDQLDYIVDPNNWENALASSDHHHYGDYDDYDREPFAAD